MASSPPWVLFVALSGVAAACGGGGENVQPGDGGPADATSDGAFDSAPDSAPDASVIDGGLLDAPPPMNVAPDAVDDAFTARENTLLQFSGDLLTANDSDGDADALHVAVVGQASAGVATLSGNIINYTPPADFVGTATFTYATSDGQATDTATVTVSVAASRVTALAAGYAHTCALRDDVDMKCWGNNFRGTLGLGDTATRGDAQGEMGAALPTVDLGAGRTVRAIALSLDNHSCAILDTGAAKCWGSNTYGQLGQGNTAHRGDGAGEMGNALQPVLVGSGRTVLQIGVGFYHTCALLDDGTVKCWGFNNNGQLGVGDTVTRGDGAGEMGDALPAVDLGTGRTATALAVGAYHACAILDDESLKCWGYSGSGQLGLGDMQNRGDGAGELGNALPTVDLGSGRTVKRIAAGATHTCALLDNGRVKCWGANTSGQLGLEDKLSRGDAAGEMGDALPAVDLGAGRTAMAIVAGTGHTCALLDNGAVKCWGDNYYGQLGLGDTVSRGDDAGEMGDALLAVNLGAGAVVVALAVGASHSCALLNDGAVKCWGGNYFGQLGLGDANHRGDGADELGDALPVVNL